MYQCVPVYIELPAGHVAEEIDFSTVKISEVSGNPVNILPAVWSLGIVDHDNNGISDFRMDFYETELAEFISPGSNSLTVTGRMNDGVSFRGAGVVNIPGTSP